MFNPEKLLGGMLRSGMRRGRGLGSMVSGGAALGLVGVAMEAVEHYMNRSQTAASKPGPPSGPPGSRPMSGAGAQPPPPPPPVGGGVAPPPSPGSGAVPEMTKQRIDALLLIRAMIAASNADGMIDADERASILDKLKSADLNPEEHQFIVNELLDPKDMESIVADVKNAQLAEQVYIASLLAIRVDTEAERRYLQELAQRLGLERGTLDGIHQKLGIEVL